MRKLVLYIASLFLVLLSSCETPQKVTYLADIDSLTIAELQQKNTRVNPVLGPGDLLNIKVFASNMASVAQFNKGMSLSADGSVTNYSQTNSINRVESSAEYYLVNSNGNIDFPVLGTIAISGKTKEQVADEIKSMIYPKYVKQPPTVEVRLMNFKVTVLGQVGKPGVITSENERMNILEAIALAGDLEIKGQRDNILLYRTNNDGTREVHRLDLTDRDILLSPYFNLQQNDFIYVEPNRSAKQNAWQMPQAWTISVSVIGGISSLASLIIGIVNLTK